MPQPEGKIVKAIQARIKKRGGRCIKIHGGDNPFQEVGIPDLLCCYRGRFVGLEVKQPGERPSPVQMVFLHEIVSSGGYASVVSSVEEVDRLLARIDREARGEIHNPRARLSLLNDSITRVSRQ
jgi:hypothetical protein